MQNLALAVESTATCQEVDIVSTGVESVGVAALLSSRGRGVRFTTNTVTLPDQLHIKGAAVNYKAGRLQFAPNVLDLSYRASDLMLVCGKASDYRAALNTVAEMLSPGQTVFVVDAPIGTAFELSCMIYKLRKRMAVNIIEMGPLFDECRFDGRALEISGLKDLVSICGRSVNETRSGLAIGRHLFSGLLPASNVLERGLSDSSRLLRIALRYFHVNALVKRQSLKFLSSEEEAMLNSMEAEINALGKVFNVNVPVRDALNFDFSDNLEREKQELANAVTETLSLLADLAKVAYLPFDTVESLIAKSSSLLGRDLVAAGRKLTDLGLSGMDVREIIELVNS